MSAIGNYVLEMMEKSGEFESSNEAAVTRQIEIDKENNLGSKNANHQHAQLAQQPSKNNDLRSIWNRENVTIGNSTPF